MNRFVLAPFAASVSILAALAAAGSPQGSQSLEDATIAAEPVKLVIRFGDGRSKFHLGEIIPIELEFSSPQRKTYRILVGSQPAKVDEYRIDPAGFRRRDFESVAAGRFHISMHRNWPVDIDPGEKPYKLQDTLNRLFRIPTPGKYRVSVTSRRMGFPVTSNVEELEILPSDPTWEEAELARGVELLKTPTGKPEHARGCEIVASLGTAAAEMEMAALYAKRGVCEETFEVGLINAANRTAVLERLDQGFRGPARLVNESFLRTLAYLRAYQQHPEWYFADVPPPAFNRATLLGMIPAEELNYAKLLVAILSHKTEEARAASLKTLLYLGSTLWSVEIPEEIRTAVREQMPAVFRKLPHLDQERVLKHRWPGIKSRAMLPVLKQIAEDFPQHYGPLALRRLYELSPEDGRPYLLRELRSEYPTVGVDVLSLLPEKELPELDGIMLERVKARFQLGDAGLVVATGLLQRFASPAVAESLHRTLIEHGIGKMECESEANLLAYFLRVAPRDGEAMLRRELQGPSRPGCLILQRLAGIRMSPEVEAAALEALKAPDPAALREALHVLQLYGSPQSKGILLRHFREWHEAWVSRAKELESPANRERASIDLAFFQAIGAAQGWLCSEEELLSLQEMCVTETCKERAAGLIRCWKSVQFTIQFAEPVGDEVVERIGMGRYQGVISTMDRLKQKLTQYPKGSVFRLDTSWSDHELADRIYAELKPWAALNGFELRK